MTVLCAVGAIVAILLSGIYSGSETGLYCINRLRLRLDADRGNARAMQLAKLVERRQDSLATMLVGTNVANYLVTVFVAMLLVRTWQVPAGATEVYTTVIVTPLVFVFGEVLPKILFQQNADRLMRRGLVLLRWSSILMRPAVAVLMRVSKLALHLVGDSARHEALDARGRMALLLQDAMASAGDAGEHRDFVDRILGLTDVALHQVMTPRNRVIVLSATADRRALESLVRKHPHSRFPVYDAHPRRMVGYVQAHALLADDAWSTVGESRRPIETLHAHDSVATAILRLQAAHETMAAIVDRRGQLLGLVTLKDLLEELTGELPDW